MRHSSVKASEFRATIRLDDIRTWDAACLHQGVYAPLNTFMGQEDYDRVLKSMRLASGTLWPLPITLPVPHDIYAAVQPGCILRLQGTDGFLARLTVTEKFCRNLSYEAQQVYGTQDPSHPGVNRLFTEPEGVLSGKIDLLRLPDQGYSEPYWPHQVRGILKDKGFRSVAFFQTRNPLHRAHEALQKTTLELVDGLVVHPLVGPTKADDVPTHVRMQTYRQVLDRYFPRERVTLAVFPSAMRYAGPKEALFHAITRKNYGATHFVVGRDAAGVGNFYLPDQALNLVASHAQEIGITPLTFRPFGYCPVCDAIASARSCPHQDKWLSLSGTELRRRLQQGIEIPPQILRPDVAEILEKAYRSQDSFDQGDQPNPKEASS